MNIFRSAINLLTRLKNSLFFEYYLEKWMRRHEIEDKVKWFKSKDPADAIGAISEYFVLGLAKAVLFFFGKQLRISGDNVDVINRASGRSAFDE